MLLYDRKDNSIDIYSICANEEKIKEYKKSIISCLDIDELFYQLTTNNSYIKSQFVDSDNLSQPLFFSNGVIMGNKGWIKLVPMKDTSSYNYQNQKELIEKYIEGEYDNLSIKSVIENRTGSNNLYKNYELLLVENFIEKRNAISTFRKAWSECNNVINLPRKLFLLYLLQHGEYGRLVFENINEQLTLFDIEYLKSVSIIDIKNMLGTGLFSDTLTDIDNKANNGSKILQKRKNM